MKRPIRILHLRTSNFVGGPEHQLLRYGEYERDGSVEITFGTLVGPSEGRDFVRAIEARGLQALALPAGSLGDVGAISALVRSLAEHAIELVCTHGYQADIVGTLAAAIRRIPAVWFLRGWTGEDWKVRIYERIDRALLPLAARIVCLSETQASQLSPPRRADAWVGQRGLAKKIRVVVNAVDVPAVTPELRRSARQELRRRLGVPIESAVVATAGRLSPEKGTAHFLQALPSIHRLFPAAHFVVFGNGPMRARLEESAKCMTLGTTLQFAGFVPDFARLLPGIDILVNPSLSEVTPNVVLEAMAAAVPVVATAVGSVSEIAGDEQAVRLVPPGDSRAVSHAVAGLLENPEAAAELGFRGQKRVREAFSPARQRAQLRALYQEMVQPLRHKAAETRNKPETQRSITTGAQRHGEKEVLN